MWGGLSYSSRMICAVVCALLVSTASWMPGDALTAPAKVTAITGSQIGDETAITIIATQPVRYRLRNVRSDWIVIDIPGTQLGRPAGQVPVVRGLVKRVRVGQFMPDIVRVVVELLQPAEFHLASTVNRQAIVVGIPLDIGGHLVARAQAVGYQTVITQTDAVAIGPEILSSQGPEAPVKTTSVPTAGTEAASPQGPAAPVKTASTPTAGTATPGSLGPAAPVKTTSTSTAGTEAANLQGPVAPEKTTSASMTGAGTPNTQGMSPAKSASVPPVTPATTGAQAPLVAPKGVTNPQARIRDVVPGRYIGPAKLGMNVQDLVAVLGPSASTDRMADGTTVYRWFKAPKNAGVGVRVSADGIVYRVWILNDAGYATTQRLHAGSTEAEIRAALGEPSQSFINTDQKLKTLTYGALGIWFSIQLDDRYLFYNNAFEIGIMQPMQPR